VRDRSSQSKKEGEAWLDGEERTVAFVDILGFADEVEKLARRPASFRRVVKALLSGSAAAVHAGAEDDLLSILASQEGKDRYGVDLQAAFFSDSTYVSARTVVGGTDKVLGVVLGYTRHLLLRGLFVRGGIARGLAVQRGGMVVGPAVLAAHSLEQKAAVYPRIVVEDAVAKGLLSIADQPNATATIRRGEDGLFFVDILTTLGLREDGQAFLLKSGKLIMKRLQDRHSPDIVAKWRWLAAQYNRAVRSVARKGKESLSPIEWPDLAELPDDP
jgi:hypothetical protein